MSAITLLAWVCFLGCLAGAGAVVALRRRLQGQRSQNAEMRTRLETLGQQLQAESDIRRELEAGLSSMSDAVIAVDTGSRLLRLNRAAGRLLAANPEGVRGRLLVEVVREEAIRNLFEETLGGTPVTDRDLRVGVADQPLDRPRRISARTAVLHGAHGHRIGAVAVLRDVTELRRLEGVRRDFVANVSHELKTPVAAIKAAVETLLDSPAAPGPRAPDTDTERADRERFLRMAVRHADRLTDIIEDLLTLARLEGDGAGLALTTDWLGPVLAAAVETCRPAAEEARVVVELDVPPGLLARMQPNLVEQAVVNLVDNAIKYGGSGGRVLVHARSEADGRVVVRVRDRGPGIRPEHLDRLFERFYRVDPSRNRTGGGTGLGLSIVRHVADACGGSVAVSSSPGEGTTFELTLQGLSPAGEAPAGGGPEASVDPFGRLALDCSS